MRYARGEAILRVIAMRYAPQLIVSQNELYSRQSLYFFLSQFHGWHGLEAVVSSPRLRNQNFLPAKSVNQ
jgi:hypothetical protein